MVFMIEPPYVESAPLPDIRPLVSVQVATPEWVLVLPYSIVDGRVSWSPTDAWSRVWRIPGRSHGFRFVSTLGDYEDKVIVPDSVLMDPDNHVDALRRLGQRYGAHCVAVLRMDVDTVKMSLIWGGQDTSQEVDVPDLGTEDRQQAYHQSLMDAMRAIVFTGDDEGVP